MYVRNPFLSTAFAVLRSAERFVDIDHNEQLRGRELYCSDISFAPNALSLFLDRPRLSACFSNGSHRVRAAWRESGVSRHKLPPRMLVVLEGTVTVPKRLPVLSSSLTSL